MCKTTDEPVGIPLPLPTILPPIENWYIVARKIRTGTCSIYSSWKNYEEETEISPPSSSKTLTPNGAEKKKRSIEDAKSTELAAFPTVAQAIAYVKNIGPQAAPRTPLASSITVASSPTTNSTGRTNSTTATRITTHASPDDSVSDASVPRDATDHIAKGSTSLSRHSPMLPTRKMANDGLTEGMRNNDERDVAPIRNSSPSPVPSESSPPKKRKMDLNSIRATIPIFTKRPLRMSTTSETINIGAPPAAKCKQQEMSSLDALAIAATSRPTKPAVRESFLEATKAATIAKTISESRDSTEEETARLSPNELLQAAIPRRGFKTFSDSKMGRTVVNQKQHEELILQKMQKEDQELERKIQEEKQKLEFFKARKESLTVAKKPSPLSDLTIPEVPKGFVPMDRNPHGLSKAISDLKSSIDRKIMMNASAPSMTMSSMATSTRNTLASHLTSVDSFPLGSNIASQLQQQQHLQKLKHQATLYRNKANLLSLQLQSSRNPLIQHLRGRSMHSSQQLTFREHLQQSAMIDLASSSSDSEHSRITLKRRNGLSSETSSPLTLGAASLLKNQERRTKK